ncbi:MAG TPA: SPW repeat protein [Capillimicrobium sp.]|nr:SPW repeat protein [Capillimicrobium sp.]
MVHQGPIPYFAHQAADYLLAALLIAAPFLLGFSDSGAATAVSIVAGVIVLVMAASTDGPLSLIDAIPIPVHIVGDVALGVLLIASPFLFGFSDDGGATAFFIVVGIVELLMVIATAFPRESRERLRGGRDARPA